MRRPRSGPGRSIRPGCRLGGTDGEVPTAADFAECNQEAPSITKAGLATPTRSDQAWAGAMPTNARALPGAAIESGCGYVVWLAESIQGFRPARRVNVKNASTARGTVFEPATTALVISATV